MKVITEKNTISLEFVPETESPVILFDSFARLFKSIIDINTELIKKVDPLIEINFFLIDVKSSSIFTNYLKQIIIPEKNVLIHQIENKTYEKYLLGQTNFNTTSLSPNP